MKGEDKRTREGDAPGPAKEEAGKVGTYTMKERQKTLR